MPINSQPSFISWPITPAMKILLSWEEKWTGIFSLNVEGLTLLLQTLFEQLDKVDYFINRVDTEQLFKFLRKLVESKPQNSQVLEEISNISLDLFEKIILKKRFNETEAKVPASYLNLINLMLEPDYRYLFEKPEITIRTANFLTLSNIPFNSSALLSQFRLTLLSSFQCKKFIKDPASLIRVISNLVKSMEKNVAESNELAAMKLFDTLGVLSHTLKNIEGLNQSRIELSIQRQRRLIYKQFKPYVERDLLNHSVYKFFLAQSYKDSENLTSLCQSKAYRRQCLSEYKRFSDVYRCQGELPDFLIDIQHNNRSRIELDHLCVAMTATESFIPWMEEQFGFRPNYNASHYFLYLADSRKNFLIDAFLLERYDVLQESYRILAVYTPSEGSNQTHLLLGSTHTYTNPLSVFIHEYVHHLSALYINNLAQDLTLLEGLAKLYSEGICSKGNFRNLKNYASDTLIFEFFKTRRFPSYFNSLKWVAYLVNEQPKLFKALVSFLQNEDRENYYGTMDTFIYNTSNQQAFVDWSHQQVEVCNDYLTVFPGGHQPALIYLEDIKNHLNLTSGMFLSSNSAVFVRKRRVISSMNESSYKTIQASGSKEVGSVAGLLQKAIPLPLSAMSAGFISACMDDVTLMHRNKYPLLPVYINYGIKPLIFASISAILDNLLFDTGAELEEKLARLYIYALTNYFSVLIGQPVAQKIAEKIHNKMACVLIQMVAWSLFWNPSLFFSKDNKFFPTLFLQLIQGVCFKVGEEAYPLGKRICFSSSFWHKKKPQTFDINDTFLNDDQEMPVNKINLR